MLLNIDSLVPDCYADYRPLVADALRLFLGQLAPGRRAALFAAQTAMPPGTPDEERAFAVMRACPTLHKLGQVLARHRALDPAFRTELRRLESLPPSIALADIRPVIACELGADAGAYSMVEEPLAEGSIAVIVPFVHHSGSGGSGTPGVFKVLRPGVAGAVHEELALTGSIGALLEERGAALGLPALPYRETFEQIRIMLLKEIDLATEQANLKRAAKFYANDPGIRIPQLLPGTTQRLTAMERLVVRKVTDAASLSGDERRRLAQALVRALLARPFFSDTDDALFHGDPHAGNLLLDDEGRLVILDWSLAGTLDRADRRAVIALLLGALTLDLKRARAGISVLLTHPDDTAALDTALRHAMTGIPWTKLPDFGWLIDLLDTLAQNGFAFRPDLFLFRKSMFTLRGVLQDLSETASLNEPIALTGAAQFAREYAVRMLYLYSRRSFGTHLTNGDLARLGLRWPLTAARYWARGLREFTDFLVAKS
jgi:ubiquinone biosynthesis protein